MTGRDRIEAAFTRDGSPAFGAVIPYEGIFYRDHYEDLLDCPWWYTCAPDLERQVEWHRQAMERTGQDWFYLPFFSARADRERMRLEERADGVYSVNRETGETRRLERPPIGGEVFGTGAAPDADVPETPAEIDRLIPPVESGSMDRMLENGHGDLARALLEGPARGLFPISHVNSPLWCTFNLWGFEGMMMMTAMQPDLVRRAADRFLAHAVHGVRTAAALGARGIWIEECLTDMISPSAFAELNVPCLQKLVAAIHDAGLHSIYYYCGDPNDRLALLLSTGAEALSLEEGKKGFRIDIESVARTVDGRCVLLGNLDAVGHLESAAEAELEREIARQLDAGRRHGSRFIMSLGSPVTPGTPVDRVRAYTDTVHRRGAA